MNTSKTTLTLTLVSIGLFGLISGCHSKSSSDEIATLKSRVSSLEQQVAMLNQAVAKTEGGAALARPSDVATDSTAAASETAAGTESTATDASATTSAAPASTQALTPMEIQKALQNAGYYHGTVDGRIGPKTVQAIKEFQTENGLTADGKIGKKTSDRLRTHL